ncbi:MAG: tripartite tricarboxylate transporter substrate binding protein [Betaproteobacteria bacterium]|nr:tripartite tricarboxylate transporter substrate binding protein [Betaproteobacteria bacterium]
MNWLKCIALPTMLAAALSAPHFAHAQASFPAKPLRMIVPFPAGGPSDVVARLLAPRLAEALAQPVVVENRAGGGGAIGADVLVRSAPDGYTLMMGTIGSVAIAPMLNPKIGYHVLRDMAPITQVVNIAYVLATHPSVPVNTLLALIALAKAQPGKLNYGSAGAGTGPHLAGELLKLMAGINMVHVPYKGSAAAQVALMSGEVDLTFENFLIVMPHFKSGRLRPLAGTGAQRSPLLPTLPTFAESGLPGYSASGWYGIVAPAATPKDAVARLNHELVRLLRTPDIANRLNSMAAEPAPGTPEQFGTFLRAEIEKWAKVVKAAGMKAE